MKRVINRRESRYRKRWCTRASGTITNSETGTGKGGITRVYTTATHTGRHNPGTPLLHTQGGITQYTHHCYTHTGRHNPGMYTLHTQGGITGYVHHSHTQGGITRVYQGGITLHTRVYQEGITLSTPGYTSGYISPPGYTSGVYLSPPGYTSGVYTSLHPGIPQGVYLPVYASL